MEARTQLKGEIREAKDRLNSTIQELNQAINTKERLERLGLEKLSQLVRFIEDFEALKFDANMVRKLAEWRNALTGMGIDPDALELFLKAKGSLGSQVQTLRTEAKRLKGVVEMLEKRRTELAESNSSLYLLSKILESKSASLPCKRCGWSIPISLERKENYMRMVNQRLGLGVWCPSCGYQNWFDPREVILNVGWIVLTP